MLEQGPAEKTIIEQCYRQRLPLPEKIANAPELTLGLDLFYVAFLELTSCRTLGFGEGPIPWLSIHSYCEVNGIDGEQREDLIHHVQLLDRVYLEWRSKQNPAPAKGPKRGKRS